MKLRHLVLPLFAPLAAVAADQFTITVTNDLSIARPAETIAVPWKQVNQALPHALVQHILVKDANGRSIPFQVTNIAPEAHDEDSIGIAYGELLFQHDFAAGEKTATFTVEKIEEITPVFPAKVFARYVPERLDDFAWENDKIAHRTYGQALGAPDTEHRGKEVLVTSALDVWSKRVPYLIVDRWYNKGHNHYHVDEGEGLDMYNAGTSRGAGGTGVWDGTKLYAGRNYRNWKVLANGPVRAIFELTYDAWDIGNGAKVSEVKRFTIDAGQNYDQIESTFTVEGGPNEITVAIGLNKNSSDRGQDSKSSVTKKQDGGWLTQWEVQKTNGSLGEGIIVPAGFAGFAEDRVNQIVLAKAVSGQPLRYYVGEGWSKAGEFTTHEAWDNYTAACAARAKSPLKATIATR